MPLHFTLLDEAQNLSEFDCNNEELNLYFKNLALLYQKRHFGVTVVGFEVTPSAKTIIGYYTLCPASIYREVVIEKVLKGPKPNPIPGFRLCRLAVDKHFQGKGYGKMLFVHALIKCVEQSKQIGGGIVIIDAKNEKAKLFYEHFGFLSLSNDPLMLFQTIKYVEKHLI